MKTYYKPRILVVRRSHRFLRNKRSKSYINRKPTTWHAIRSAFRTLRRNFG